MASLTLQLDAILPDGTNLSAPSEIFTVPMLGEEGIKYNFEADGSDGTFDVGEVSQIGMVQLRNRSAKVLVTTPGAPTIEPVGTPGATTVSYKIVALQSDGAFSVASSAGTTTTAAASLDTTDFNRITWDAVDGADFYDIYRTAAGGTPSSTGLIGTVAATVTAFSDTGLSGDASTAPATAIDNELRYDTTTAYDYFLKGGEVAIFRLTGNTLRFKASADNVTNSVNVRGEITILED
jgi:hypothetical protein